MLVIARNAVPKQSSLIASVRFGHLAMAKSHGISRGDVTPPTSSRQIRQDAAMLSQNEIYSFAASAFGSGRNWVSTAPTNAYPPATHAPTIATRAGSGVAEAESVSVIHAAAVPRTRPPMFAAKLSP